MEKLWEQATAMVFEQSLNILWKAYAKILKGFFSLVMGNYNNYK